MNLFPACNIMEGACIRKLNNIFGNTLSMHVRRVLPAKLLQILKEWAMSAWLGEPYDALLQTQWDEFYSNTLGTLAMLQSVMRQHTYLVLNEGNMIVRLHGCLYAMACKFKRGV